MMDVEVEVCHRQNISSRDSTNEAREALLLADFSGPVKEYLE